MRISPYVADSMHLDVWQKFEKIVKETLNTASKIIDVSLEDIEQGDGLLSKFQNSVSSREDIHRIFADFIIAAGDTTAFSTLWCLYLLAKHQTVQEKVRFSIIQSGDLESPLIRATVKETLRMFPVAPFIGRFLDQDSIIGGYNIPKNTLALLSLYSAGRDETNFLRPNEFIPQRWMRGNERSESYQPFNVNASLPFAMGSRSCVGRRIALYQMHFLLSKLLQHYKITVDNTEVEAELKLVTIPKNKFKLMFTNFN
ncbi:cytochrome P450 315a1, mitochondrial [Wyeomyia smithii]|uniref:cytochrome P450 315a1, mitochondrial n=1 Tax=Wyeomyia smithii TaxID=174621 RepID=UPI00246809E2|nr:cytochrome P450 315a1, mitochondrial [Wyeomyia smithii]